MKRISAFLLALLTVFSLSSCGKEKAEKYCYNCGVGLLKDVSYCSECGAFVKDIGKTTTAESTTETTTEKATEATTEATTEAPTTTATTVTTTSAATAAAPKTEHKHSYSKKVTPATCKQKGFTLYTCSCGKSYKDNYTEPSHDYKDSVCTRCNAFDNTQAINTLAECVMKNGKKSGDSLYYLPFAPENQNITFRIYYDAESDEMYTILHTYSKDDNELATTFELDFIPESNKFRYESNYIDTFKITGTVDGSTFKKDDPLEYDFYEGDEKHKNTAAKLASSGTSVTLGFLKMTSDLFKLGLTLKDFGFTAYEQ